MKLFLVVVAMVWAGTGYAGDQPAAAPAPSLSGKVLEVQQAGSYTYLRLKTKDGEMWAATSRAAIVKGAEVQLNNVMVMTNFQSKALNRKFDQIVFGDLAGAPTRGADMAAAHAGVPWLPGLDGAFLEQVVEVAAYGGRREAQPHGQVCRGGRAVLQQRPRHPLTRRPVPHREGRGSCGEFHYASVTLMAERFK